MNSKLADHIAIVETCARMAWHADQREWEALTGLFAEEVLVDYTSLNGGTPEILSGEQLVSGWRSGLSNFSSTQHLVTNHLVDLDGDVAVATAAFQATHLLPNAQGGPLWTIGGNYRYGLVRTDNGWRINALTMTMTWADGNRQLLELTAASD